MGAIIILIILLITGGTSPPRIVAEQNSEHQIPARSFAYNGSLFGLPHGNFSVT